jgi:hypothetical protein
MDPLIWWAVEFVERFAGDCLTALDWFHGVRERCMTDAVTAGHDIEAAVTWLRSLPEHPRLDSGVPRRDMTYLAALSPTGLPRVSIWRGLDRLRKSRGQLPPLAATATSKPLPIATTTAINGLPWLAPSGVTSTTSAPAARRAYGSRCRALAPS